MRIRFSVYMSAFSYTMTATADDLGLFGFVKSQKLKLYCLLFSSFTKLPREL